MKSIYRTIIAILIISMLPIGVLADTNTTPDENIIYFDDGSYLVVELSVIDTRAASGRVGTKTYTYHANNGDIEWSATLNATFKFDGTTSSCSSSSCRVEIENTNWYEISNSATKSGNTAAVELTMGYKWLGIKINERTINMTLTCDANGNLS